MERIEPEAIRPRPDYPPRTPPPPKRPPSPPVPESRDGLPAGLPVPWRAGRGGQVVMRNRRGAAWALEARSWAGAKAVRVVSDRLAAWGFASPGCLEAVVRLLVATVVADGGRHVSLHLAEQDHTVLVLAFSHRAAPVGGGGCEEAGVLSVLRRLGADSCGTETASEGRQVWALLPLSAPIVSGGRGAPG